MLHRIINWIKNPFKKKEKVEFTLPEVVPLTEEQKNKIKTDLIQAVKEFKEKKDLDVLPISRISEDIKEKIADIVKEDIQNQVEPVTEEVKLPTPEVAKVAEPKKRKSYYKKKSSSKKKETK